MKCFCLVLVGALCVVARTAVAADVEVVAEDAPVVVSEPKDNSRAGRAMAEADDEEDDYSDMDELIRYLQRGVMRFVNKVTGLQERENLGDAVPAILNRIQRGVRRFINRMTSPEERQSPLTSTIPFIGRLIFRSLSYLGSFLVGALAVPPLLAGNALSLFGLYRPTEPNELISQPVLPGLFGQQQQQQQHQLHSDRLSSGGVSGSSAHLPVNDLSEALFRLGQRNQHASPHNDAGQAETLLAQAAGSSNPVEISEIVNDLIRVQTNNRPASLWSRLTRGLSVFLPQVSRQVTPAGAFGSLLFLGTLLGAPYLLNRRSDATAGLFGDDSTNDETADSFENYYLRPPRERYGQGSGSDYEGPAEGKRGGVAGNGNGRKRKSDVAEAAQAGEAYSGPGDQQQQRGRQQATAPDAYSPYRYVNRRRGEAAKDEGKDGGASPVNAA